MPKSQLGMNMIPGASVREDKNDQDRVGIDDEDNSAIHHLNQLNNKKYLQQSIEATKSADLNS